MRWGEWEAWLKAGTGDDKGTDTWSLRISGSVPVAFSAATATFLPPGTSPAWRKLLAQAGVDLAARPAASAKAG